MNTRYLVWLVRRGLVTVGMASFWVAIFLFAAFVLLRLERPPTG